MSGPATNTVADSPPCRRFNIGDCLILICALSISLVPLRSTRWFTRFPIRIGFWSEAFPELLGLSPWTFPNLTRGDLEKDIASTIVDEFLVQLLSCVLLGLTLAVPLIRLRRPRPPLRTLFRQPGFVACITVIVATLLMVDVDWIRIIHFTRWMVWGLALVLLWPVLALPPWCAEQTWVDRLGRAVGLGWIVVTVSRTYLNYL